MSVFKKIVSILAAALALAVCFTACKGPAAEPFDAEKALDRLLNEVKYDGELEDVSEYAEFTLNDIPEGSEIRMYTAGGKLADAVIMVKVPSAEDVETVKASISEYVDSRREEASRYEPEEVPKLDNAVVYANGEYVFACITNDVSSASTILK